MDAESHQRLVEALKEVVIQHCKTGSSVSVHPAAAKLPPLIRLKKDSVRIVTCAMSIS